MTNTCLVLCAAILLSSCAPAINYLGNTFQPTNNVDVFVDETAITKEYTIMGKGYVRTYAYSVPESLQQKALAKAREKGADAILFKDYFVPANQPQTRSKKDHQDGVTISVTHPAQVQNASPEVVVFFLKYKQ